MNFGAWFSAKYIMLDYDSEANWNLRTDFAHPKSFEHDADGSGVSIDAGMRFKVKKNFTVGVELNYSRWETDAGNNRTYFSNGMVGTTQFNGATWDSLAIMITPYYSW